jgi:hypothetical protein
VITLVRTQATMSQKGDPRLRAMAAETMKMPDPIIDPATSIVASVRVRAFTNSGWGCCCGASTRAATLLM